MSLSAPAARTAAAPPDAALPPTRPVGVLAFVLPVLLAGVVGACAGLDPGGTAVVAGAVVSALVLVRRVEWAALAVVTAGVWDGWSSVFTPWVTEWLCAVLVVAWAVRRARGPLHSHRPAVPSRALVPAAVFGAVLVVAAAPHDPPALHSLAGCAGWLVTGLVLADCLAGPLPVRRAAHWYVASGVVASCCALVVAAASTDHRVVGPAAGTGALTVAAIAAVPLAATLGGRPGRPVWWTWVAVAVLVLGAAGAQTRAAVVGLTAVVVLAGVVRVVTLRAAGALLALLGSGVALTAAVLPSAVRDALADPQSYGAASVGPGTPATLAVQVGVVGAAAVYLVWLAPALSAWHRWRRTRSSAAGAVLLALAGTLTASLLVPATVAMPVWFVAAAAFASGLRTSLPLPLLGGSPRRGTSGQVAATS